MSQDKVTLDQILNADTRITIPLNDLNKFIQAQEAVERVRELHKSGKAYLDDQPMCIHCRTVEFPCPTIKALDGDQP